jgi:hypothetical protein
LIGSVGVVPEGCGPVDEPSTDDPRPDDGTTVDIVATTGLVTSSTTVVIGRVATGTAAFVVESTALAVLETLVGTAVEGLTTPVAVVATVPGTAPMVETVGARGAGRGEASAAPANAADRANPTTTPATPPPRSSAIRLSLPGGRARSLKSASFGPGVTTALTLPLKVNR